ncbi:CAF17-like 4Fe-4S cluster assembly/insertion protein YgfZ [Gemmobacter serpentinus]|uniref:CAF17-like 4Fe-4S cluster assembly/insertion protein YgfZ n=1 Tax=Gemmobacter serpentinus TaxID=2652247 RepID=UPI00124D25A5|nr:folate-binding protein YgfZ [Gemmobacter serpentinus]
MRRLVSLTGPDSLSFLQGLVTNDVLRLKEPGLVYAALLSPQGKFLVDFFIANTGTAENGTDLLLDLPDPYADATLRRLNMYRLRAQVQIAPSDLVMTRGTGDAPEGALPDPRHPALGWRHYGAALPEQAIDWDAIRVAHLIPEIGIELIPDETFILEAGFEALHGVDFRKGCYVGQEVTARMKHKTELRKGLTRLAISGAAEPGTPILMEDGREAGRLGTQSGARALAHMRFDRMDGPLRAGEALLTREGPAPQG